MVFLGNGFPKGVYKGKQPEADFFEIWAYPYRKMQRKIAVGGFFGIWALPYRMMQRETAGGGFFHNWAFPYREMQRKTAGGGKILTFGNFPIGKYKGKPPGA